ncbi:MAG: hypothetical protein WAL63_10535 [Solirubrobacteraceae bacterium]
MRTRSRGPRTWLGMAGGAILVALALAACGTSSGSGASSTADAQSVVARTFSGAHVVKSGVLDFALTITPSSAPTSRISLSLSGPFQSRGSGKVPASDFAISIGALGKRSSLGVVSTGTKGYVTLQGTSYRLPPAQFKQFESSLSAAATSSKGRAGLAGLGINPADWLQNPTVVGNDTIAGAPTTHIRAGVNAARLLSDLNTVLAKTATTSGTTKVPPSIPTAAAAKVKNATVDVWTGKTDSTLRRLALHLTLPRSGQTGTTLGGLSSAAVGLTVQYSHLNQPQVIAAPTSVRPYRELAGKLQGLASAVQGVGSATSTSQGSVPAPGAVTSAASRYTECIEQAGDDVARMQKCAPLLHPA